MYQKNQQEEEWMKGEGRVKGKKKEEKKGFGEEEEE